MKLGDLEFTAENIFDICRNLTIIPGERDSCDAIAEAVNRELERRIRKAPEIGFTFEEIRPCTLVPDSPFHHIQVSHCGRVVCIEALPTDKELHDAAKCL